VLKAQDTIQVRRIEWDAGWNDIAAAFLTIKRAAKNSGQITYSASGTDATGHSNIAWAVDACADLYAARITDGLTKPLQTTAPFRAFKLNLLLRDFVPSAASSALTMGCTALDIMVLGEGYFQCRRNLPVQVVGLRHLHALNSDVRSAAAS
jgi:hypothetical protein